MRQATYPWINVRIQTGEGEWVTFQDIRCDEDYEQLASFLLGMGAS